MNTDYNISSGGAVTDNMVTLKWLTPGSKTVKVNYTDKNGCFAATATASTATILTTCNTPPVINSNGGDTNAAISISENSKAVTIVSASDAEVPLQTLTYTISGGADAVMFSINNLTGEIEFLSVPNFELPLDTDKNNVYEIQVVVTDSGLGQLIDVQYLSVTVVNVNELPVIGDIAKNGTEDVNLSFSVADFSTKFADIDGDSMKKIKVVSLPSDGTLKVGLNALTLGDEILLTNLADITFTPDHNWFGSTSFDWNGYDGAGYALAFEQVNIMISPLNDAPIANAVAITTTEDTTVSSLITASDQEGDILTFDKSENPKHGTAMVNSNGTFTYSPTANFHGTDSFTVTISDGNAGIMAITVNVLVFKVNDAPVILPYSLTTLEDTYAIGVVTASDPDGDELSFSMESSPSHGLVSINTNGEFNYTPSADYFGNDSFSVKVSDGNGNSATSIVQVTIEPVNDVPSFGNGGNQSVCGNSILEYVSNWTTSIAAGPSNESSQIVQFKVTNNNNSLFSVQPSIDSAGTLFYIPAANKYGEAIVSVQATDNGGKLNGGRNASELQTFTITTHSPPEEPTIITTQIFCSDATIADLRATAPSGSTLAWYSAMSGGSPLPDSFPLVNATLYFAESTSLTTGCKSLLRSFAVAIINEPPVDPSGSQLQTFCMSEAAKVSNLFVQGVNIKWYDEAEGGGEVSDGKLLTDASKYYASQFLNGCESSHRLAVTVSIVACNVSSERAPRVVDFARTTVQNQSLTFEQSDFTSNFVEQENNALVNIRIESLPTNGTLMLAGVNISSGQEITLGDLNKLEFVPQKSYSGETSFRWVASNGLVYSETEAHVRITVTAAEVYIPSGFSPNGDGINDYFVVKGADQYVVTLKIFTRWGVRVYESNHYRNDWNGYSNINGLVINKIPEGTYFYSINYNNGGKEIVGYLTLAR